MRGNQLFGIFSPEKLKKVIPPHRSRGPGRSPDVGEWQKGDFPAGCRVHSAFSVLKSLKSDSPAPGSRGPGRSPDAGESAFRHFQP